MNVSDLTQRKKRTTVSMKDDMRYHGEIQRACHLLPSIEAAYESLADRRSGAATVFSGDSSHSCHSRHSPSEHLLSVESVHHNPTRSAWNFVVSWLCASKYATKGSNLLHKQLSLCQ